MPPLPDSIRSILDLGCGAGQTLIASEIDDDVLAVGLDIDEEALTLGAELTDAIKFVKGRGEELPFQDHSFDVVISRVALPYTLIPNASKEISRVLKPGGQVWLTFHPFSMLFKSTIAAIVSRNMKGIVYQFYILINSLLFHLTGRMFRYPLNQSRCESVQTNRSVSRALKQAGFDQIVMENGQSFVARAIK